MHYDIGESLNVIFIIMLGLSLIGLLAITGGGKLLDKWIDRAKVKWFAGTEKMPEWSLKVLRIASYIIYAALVVFVFLHNPNE